MKALHVPSATAVRTTDDDTGAQDSRSIVLPSPRPTSIGSRCTRLRALRWISEIRRGRFNGFSPANRAGPAFLASIAGECPSDRNALLLAAGELRGELVEPVAEAHPDEPLVRSVGAVAHRAEDAGANPSATRAVACPSCLMEVSSARWRRGQVRSPRGSPGTTRCWMIFARGRLASSRCSARGTRRLPNGMSFRGRCPRTIKRDGWRSRPNVG